MRYNRTVVGSDPGPAGNQARPPPEVSMTLGANHLTRIFGTEAHQIGRQVTLERVLAIG